jgi:hypothetical protein
MTTGQDPHEADDPPLPGIKDLINNIITGLYFGSSLLRLYFRSGELPAGNSVNRCNVSARYNYLNYLLAAH